MTHAYWREGGEEFGNVNVMGVAHGTDKELVLAHKAGDRPAPSRRRHPRQLHQRLLGRPQRNQAQRNLPLRLPRLVPPPTASTRGRCATSEPDQRSMALPSRPVIFRQGSGTQEVC